MNRSIRTSLLGGALLLGAGSIAGMKAYSEPAVPAGNAYLLADLSDKILYVYEGDSVSYMYDISDGKDPYPTPRGNFKIRKLNWNPSWTPPDSKWAAKKRPTAPGDPKNPMKVVNPTITSTALPTSEAWEHRSPTAASECTLRM
jgi:lipoprotein-anchoring transpeptidase ErfK/SrfK